MQEISQRTSFYHLSPGFPVICQHPEAAHLNVVNFFTEWVLSSFLLDRVDGRCRWANLSFIYGSSRI